MPEVFTKPVEDSVPKVAGDVAVGEDLEFQRKWWRFEHVIWILFLLILVCDLLGLFGRGWLAKAKISTPDHVLTISYERVERASTPSIMTLHFAPSAVHDGRIQVFVSDNVIRRLGAQRISPQPQLSTLTQGGINYTFAASTAATIVQFALEPSFPGMHHIKIEVPGSEPLQAKIFVVP